MEQMNGQPKGSQRASRLIAGSAPAQDEVVQGERTPGEHLLKQENQGERERERVASVHQTRPTLVRCAGSRAGGEAGGGAKR